MSANESTKGGDSGGAAHGTSPTVVEGVAHNGKRCRVIDNTGSIARAELQGLLAQLIEQRRFGVSGLSAAGSNSIRVGAPDFTHIQIAERLYRLILLPYEARLEEF